MNNLHISLTEFTNESRVLRETRSLKKHEIFDNVFIAALHGDNLSTYATISPGIFLYRFNLKTRKLGKGMLLQFCKYLELSIKIWRNYKNKNIQCINVHNVYMLPVGYILKALWGSKLIYDTHELETEVTGLYGARKKILKIVEKLLVSKVDFIFVVSPSIADWYKSTYQVPRPTVILNLPNAYLPVKSDILREKCNIKEEQIIFLYQGGLYAGRGLDLLLEAFNNRNNDKAVIVFMGYGELERKIRKSANKNSRIFFYPAVSPDSVLDYTASADIGISFTENTCLSHYYCLPNKLFEYIMAGLPVIVSNMKEMRNYVDKYCLGMVVKGGNSNAINEAIDKLLSQDLRMLKRNVRKAALKYSWETQEKKMIKSYGTLFPKVNE